MKAFPATLFLLISKRILRGSKTLFWLQDVASNNYEIIISRNADFATECLRNCKKKQLKKVLAWGSQVFLPKNF